MEHHELEHLIDKYNTGKASPEERALIESWYLEHKPYPVKLSHQQLKEDKEESLYLLLHRIGERKHKPQRIFAAAASLLLFLAAGTYFLVHKNKPTTDKQFTKVLLQHDAAPGGNKATLTLANGATIILTGAQNGRLASQGNLVINKTTDGKISYDHGKDCIRQKTPAYNIATTPRGGQFQFVLSDGTKVWLNSASSIKYPVEFFGNERKVELAGEAYFEVMHNAKKPFRVVTNGQTVEVLGTHFNINAYGNEDAVKTTLAEGSVKITTPSGSNMIKPGEQAQLKNGLVNVSDVDVNEVIAWKNGFFYFRDNNIEEVMRQLSRWYDVDVQYEGRLPVRQFSGEISRNVNASQILDILSFKKIHFVIKGKTIIVKR